MKALLASTIICLASLTLTTSCSVFSGDATAFERVESSIPYIRVASYVAAAEIIAKETTLEDKVEKARILDSIATVIIELGEQDSVSEESLRAAIESVAPDKAHWSNLAGSLSGIYASNIEKLENSDAGVAIDVLVAISRGCRDASAPILSELPIDYEGQTSSINSTDL